MQSEPPLAPYTRLLNYEEFYNQIKVTTNNLEIFVERLDIQVVFSPKATNYIGKAQYSLTGHRYTIFLSRMYFKMIDVQQLEVLYHELAHIIAHSIDGTMEHNETWRSVMHSFGYEFPTHLIVPLGR